MGNLTYRNNWEADEYYVDGKRITSLEEVEENGVTYPVTTRRVSVPYNDMGHTYSGTSDHYFIEVSNLSTIMLLDLNRIVPKNPNIKATKFTFAD